MTNSRIRRAVRAGQFYEASPTALRNAAKECAAGFVPPDSIGKLFGGVVPHAGWMFSGPTAAKVFVTLSAAEFETYVLLGAVHSWYGEKGGVYPAGAWETPLGKIEVDDDLAAAILDSGGNACEASESAHNMEHSIEVQLPLIQVFSPSARIVPVAVPHSADVVAIGSAVADAISGSGRRAAVVASTDLTHYGMGYGIDDHGPLRKAMPWMRENDRRIIELAQRLEGEQIVPEAAAHFNACGPGALAAAVCACRKLGADEGRLLEYTTSADVFPEPGADRAVGYAGLVFIGKGAD